MKMLVLINLCVTVYVLILLKKEQLRTRVLRAFIAGAIQEFTQMFAAINKHKDGSEAYSWILGSFIFNFEQDFDNVSKFIRKQRYLFGEEKNGFNRIYLDFFKKLSEKYKREVGGQKIVDKLKEVGKE